MFPPPFTLQKVIVLGALAAVVWVYAIWQWRGQWVRYRRKREIIDKGGIQPARRERNRRTVFLVLVIAFALAVAGLSVGMDQFGTPSARARFHGIESRQWPPVIPMPPVRQDKRRSLPDHLRREHPFLIHLPSPEPAQVGVTWAGEARFTKS